MATMLLDMTNEEKQRRENSDSIRIRKPLAKMLRALANHRDVSLPEYLEEVLQPIVDEQFPKMLQEQMAGLKKRKPSG